MIAHDYHPLIWKELAVLDINDRYVVKDEGWPGSCQLLGASDGRDQRHTAQHEHRKLKCVLEDSGGATTRMVLIPIHTLKVAFPKVKHVQPLWPTLAS
jgi:hypothetical protein